MPDVSPPSPSFVARRFAAGEVIGEFTIVGVLGEGGSATVYDARWGHRAVALKVVRDDLGAAEASRFVDEARLLIDMAHPGVVKVLAAGTLPDGRAFLAMEKLEGHSLARRLVDGPLGLAPALALFEQLCDAVAAMHAVGLVHRDLKPENVMVVDSGRALHAVLLDFGIAKAMVDGAVTLTQTGQVRGTPAYMAPERFFGSPASVATDVYELAVTLYAMIAGRLPWDDTADPDVRLNPARLASVADVPAALDEELARALSTRAANRPPDVSALRERVRRAAGVGPATPGRVTAPVEVPAPPALAPTVAARVAATPGQPWRQPGGGATTATVAAGERHDPSPATTAPRPRRRRWPWVAAGAAVALAGGVVAVRWVADGGATRPARPDPWAIVATDPVAQGEALPASQAPPALAQLELTADRKSELRSEMAQALLHHSPDATVILGLSIAEARASEAFAPAVAAASESTALTQMRMLFAGSCDLELAARGQWMTLALVSRPGMMLDDWELIVRGDWTRDRLEPCLGRGRPGPVERVAAPGLPGTPLTAIPTDGAPQYVGWFDDHTFIVSTGGLDAAAMAARLQPRTDRPSRLDEIGSRVDRHTSVWLVGTRDAVAKQIETPELAADFTVRLELDESGLAAVLALYPRDRKAGDRAFAAATTLVDKLRNDPLLGLALPELALERDGATVRMRGRLPPGLLDKLGAQLAKALP